MSKKITVAFTTLGCRANHAVTDGAMALLSDEFERVPFEGKADIYVVNTCAVTAFADRQSRQLLYRAFRNNPKAAIIAAGCYANVAADEIAKNLPTAALAAGDSSEEIAATIYKIAKVPMESVALGDYPRTKTRMYAKIQDGCPYACAYCIVPKARPGSKSLEIIDVLNYCHSIEKTGAREIILTGVNLALWGRDLNPKTELSALLPLLCSEFRNVRFRISSLEPFFDNRKLFEAMAKEPNVCKHLHMPLQSGSDSVLRRMKRPYTAADYEKIAASAFELMPDLTLGTDVIAGFNGETQEEFDATIAFLRRMPFSYAHVFPMSLRKNTEAAVMDGTLRQTVVKERAAALRAVSNDKKRDFYLKHVGKTVEVIVEKIERNGGRGVSREYLQVLVKGVKEKTDEPVIAVVEEADMSAPRLIASLARKAE